MSERRAGRLITAQDLTIVAIVDACELPTWHLIAGGGGLTDDISAMSPWPGGLLWRHEEKMSLAVRRLHV